VVRTTKGFFEEPSRFENETAEKPGSVGYAQLKIGNGGRVVIPAEMRAAMRVQPGDMVTAEVVEGELRVLSRAAVYHRIDEAAAKFKAENPGVSVVDELIADRRAEARREDERFDRLEREAAEAAARRSGRQ